MPKYRVKVSYTQTGLQGLLRDGGTKRRALVEHLIEGMGGSMKAFYYAFGGDDLYVIADVPDEASITDVSLAVGATGSVSLSTTVLIDPETVDKAPKKVVSYTPPGQ